MQGQAILNQDQCGLVTQHIGYGPLKNKKIILKKKKKKPKPLSVVEMHVNKNVLSKFRFTFKETAKFNWLCIMVHQYA